MNQNCEPLPIAMKKTPSRFPLSSSLAFKIGFDHPIDIRRERRYETDRGHVDVQGLRSCVRSFLIALSFTEASQLRFRYHARGAESVTTK